MDGVQSVAERFRAWWEWLRKQQRETGERRISQHELGRRIGVHQTAVSKLLRGKWLPRDVDVLFAIQRETTGWPEGPIEVSEWHEAKLAAPEPQKECA